jgi:hypothetical protein
MMLVGGEFRSRFCSLNTRRLQTNYGWAWGVPALETYKPEITYSPMLSHVSELRVFPANYLYDHAANNPVQWVRDQVDRLCGESEDDAA